MTTAADQNTAAAAEAPMHDRRLSHSNSFTTASESPLLSPASSPSLPSSSCERIPAPELDRQSSSLSSASSYESFYQIDTTAADHELAPTTLPPAVQTMMAQGQPDAVPGYDPKRLPSAMFRTTQSTTCAAEEWSAASDQSLFSIQLENSGELGVGGPLYGAGDLYYDADGVFHRLSSATRLPAVPEVRPSPGGSGGGLCVKDECGRCGGGGGSMSRKSVRFAATADVGDCRRTPASPTLSATVEEEEATTTTEPGVAADGRCCWPWPSLWWPGCACRGCDCRCGDCRGS